MNYTPKIINSKIIQQPFPHIIIDDFLEEELYNDIINKLYKSENDLFKNIDIQNNRSTKAIYSGNEYCDKKFNIQNDDISLEKKYAEILLNKDFQKSIIEKFIQNKNLDKNIIDKHKLTMIQLDCFRDNYNYKIHTDSGCKFITILLYLAKDNSNLNIGTNVYDHKKKLINNINYKPNRLVIFSPSKVHDPENNHYISYHNMQGETDINFRRYSFQSWYLTTKGGYSKYVRYGSNSS